MPVIFQQKESTMLNRTLLFSVIAAAVAALFLFCASSSAVAADENVPSLSSYFDRAVILGQNQNNRNNPTFFDQIRRTWNNILRDDAPSNENQAPPPLTAPPGIPMQPPRPLTIAEIREAIATGNNGTNGNASQARVGSGQASSRAASDAVSEGEPSIQDRMRGMRETVWANPEVERRAIETRQAQQRAAMLTPSPAHNAGNRQGGIAEEIRASEIRASEIRAGEIRDFGGLPVVTRNPANRPTVIDERSEVFVPINFDSQPVRLRTDHPSGAMSSGTMPSQVQTSDPFPSSRTIQQPPQQLVVAAEQQRRDPSRHLLVSASPRLEFEIEKPPSTNVGQEITYRIRATNVGNVPAEQVVLNVEIPPWVDIRHTDADNGNWVLIPRGDGSGIADLEWRVNRINQGASNLLALWLIPQQHRTVELPIRYNFHRPAIVAKVEVQEPRLEMELVGPDEVRWNDFVTYTLIVRNVGNGSAEGLRFELLQTSSEAQTSTMDEPLLPGEGQEIPILVRAGREQELIDIAVLAAGAHELRSEVRRRIRVLRPKLEMSVQTSPLHFVDDPAELFIRVVNNGNADAENVTIRAELPLGAQHVASSEGGLFVQQQQQNTVEWRGRSIARGEILTLSLICVPRRAGECRVSVEATEPNGSVLVTGHGTFMAEAIVELDLVVHRPSGPIELGQEVTYTIEVTNIGTKAAEDVEISMMFGAQLEPIAVSGREAHYTTDGQVLFERLPVILPKQTITLRVTVEAKRAGTAQIRAEVARTDASGTPIRLEQGLSAHIFSRRTVAELPPQSDFFR